MKIIINEENENNILDNNISLKAKILLTEITQILFDKNTNEIELDELNSIIMNNINELIKELVDNDYFILL